MNETKKAGTGYEAVATALRTELRKLSPAGEELSIDEIELVAGGACHWTKPSLDADSTCMGHFPD